LKTNAEISSEQVNSCLGVINVLTGCLRGLRDADEKPCPEVATSLESTIIRTCNRLDNILDDAGRWKLLKLDAHALALEHGQWTNKVMEHQDVMLEIRKQTTLAALNAEIVDAEVIPPPPTRRQRKKQK
jgi:hypothetical protein